MTVQCTGSSILQHVPGFGTVASVLFPSSCSTCRVASCASLRGRQKISDKMGNHLLCEAQRPPAIPLLRSLVDTVVPQQSDACFFFSLFSLAYRSLAGRFWLEVFRQNFLFTPKIDPIMPGATPPAGRGSQCRKGREGRGCSCGQRGHPGVGWRRARST